MGTDKNPTTTTTKINNLIHLFKLQQIHLETLIKERKILEDRLKIKNQRWVSYVQPLQHMISQMKGDLVIQEMERFYDEAKTDLAVGLKEREAAFHKFMSDRTEQELKDLKMWCDALCQKLSDPKDITGGIEIDITSTRSIKEEEQRSKILEAEILSLKHEYEKLSLKKDAEVSALLLEKDFVWHQFKTMESNYNDKLKNKDTQIEQANEKIENLIARLEQLQASNIEKDDTIEALRSKLTKMEADKSKRDDEICRISQELESLRKSKASDTPLLNRCKVKPRISGFGDKKSDSGRTSLHAKKEQSAPNIRNHVKFSEKGSGSLKRKVEVIPIPDTPKLFSSSFKVPKLKYSSPPIR